MGKKKNPGRFIRESDIRNMLRDTAADSFEMYAAVMLTVLRDKFGFGRIRLNRALGAMNGLVDEMQRGRISHEDLVQVLLDEAHVDLRVVTDAMKGRNQK